MVRYPRCRVCSSTAGFSQEMALKSAWPNSAPVSQSAWARSVPASASE